MARTRQRAETAITGLGRAGLAARGVNYLLVAWVAVLLAARRSSTAADRSGALAQLANRAVGRGSLLVLAAGLVGYALWRLTEAWTGRTSTRSADGPQRLAAAATGILYLGLAASTVAVAFHHQGESAGQEQQTWTSHLLGWPAGRALVVGAGLVLVGVGVGNVYVGVSQRFLAQLRQGDLTPATARAVRVVGVAGHTGRGIGFALAGVFVVAAGWQGDPRRSRGLDGALHTLLGHRLGTVAVLVVAAGLAAFAVYSFGEARWRRVLPA